MKQVYTTNQERKSDRLRGCIALPLVNGTLWVIALIVNQELTRIAVEHLFCMMAWPVNGIILAWAFLFRPEVGTGYILSIALTLVVVMIAGTLFLASCVAGYAVGIPLGSVMGPVGHALGFLAFFVLFLSGLYYLYRWAADVYENRWSPPGSNRSSHTVRLWRVDDGSLLRTLRGHKGSMRSLAFSPDGAILASGSRDGTVRLWDVQDGTLLHVLKGHAGRFSPDGALLALWLGYSRVMLWQVVNETPLRILEAPEGQPLSVAFSPDGMVLASWGEEPSVIRLQRMADGALLRTLPGHEDPVRRMTFSPDGMILAAESRNDKVRLWDVGDGTLLHVLEGYNGHFSPDSALLALGSQAGEARLWDVKEGTLRHALKGRDGCFSPDGTLLASRSWDGKVRLWDVKEETLLHVLEGNDGCFSPDGALLASTGDGKVMLWRAADGTLLRTLRVLGDFKPKIAFAPDGKILATG